MVLSTDNLKKLELDDLFIKQTDANVLKKIEIKELARICFGHLQNAELIWGVSDFNKPHEYLSIKWDSERDFKQTSIDELKRRFPHHLKSWLDVAKKCHGIEGEIPTGALTRSQARHLKYLQTPKISLTLAESQRDMFSERALFQGDVFCVQNSVRNLYTELVKNETFNEALTGLGGHITIHQDLNNLLRKSYKSLRLVVKKAKDEN